MTVILRLMHTALQRVRALARRGRMPAWARPWLGVARRAACVGLAAAAAFTLWVKVNHDRQITARVLRPHAVSLSVRESDRWQCIYRAIRAAVPEGSRVDVNFPKNLVYFQRLTELSTGWAVPQSTAAGAQWQLQIYRHHGFCSGLAVAVQHP